MPWKWPVQNFKKIGTEVTDKSTKNMRYKFTKKLYSRLQWTLALFRAIIHPVLCRVIPAALSAQEKPPSKWSKPIRLNLKDSPGLLPKSPSVMSWKRLCLLCRDVGTNLSSYIHLRATTKISPFYTASCAILTLLFVSHITELFQCVECL